MKAESIEGKLYIRLQPDEPRNRVEIRSTRPVMASRLFIGKTIDEVLATVPLLFSICSNAQLVASLRAIESASGMPAAGPSEAWREALVLLETVREQLWRILLEWPRLSDYREDQENLARFNRQLNNLIQLLRSDSGIAGLSAENPGAGIDLSQWNRLAGEIETHLFDMPARKWLDNTGICSLEYWCDYHCSLPVSLIRDIFDNRWHSIGFSEYLPLRNDFDSAIRTLLESDDAADFIAQPVLNGHCLETGPLARHDAHPMIEDLLGLYGNGLLTRLTARLVDLASAMVWLDDFFNHHRDKQEFVPATGGTAAVEAARGRLMHRVVTEGDHIADYRILAPTEWNFHPSGVACRALTSLRDTNPERLRRQAEYVIHAIDPCVSYDLEIGAPDA